MRMTGPRLSTNSRNSNVDRPNRDGSELVMPRWRFSHLLLAPHRLAFFMAAVMLATSALWWAALLLARALQWPLSPVVPATLMHALLMSLGYHAAIFCWFFVHRRTQMAQTACGQCTQSVARTGHPDDRLGAGLDRAALAIAHGSCRHGSGCAGLDHFEPALCAHGLVQPGE